MYITTMMISHYRPRHSSIILESDESDVLRFREAAELFVESPEFLEHRPANYNSLAKQNEPGQQDLGRFLPNPPLQVRPNRAVLKR